jgi:hypothetical protein
LLHVLYIRNAIAQARDAGNRKSEKPGCRSSEGGEVRPGFTNIRIVLPGRTTVYTANQSFFTRGLYTMIRVRGDGGSSGSSAI